MKRILFVFMGIILYTSILMSSPVDDFSAIFEDLFLNTQDDVGFIFLKLPSDARVLSTAGGWKNTAFLQVPNTSLFYDINMSAMLLPAGDKYGTVNFLVSKNRFYMGIDIVYLNYGSMEIRDSVPTINPLDEYSPSDVKIGARVGVKYYDLLFFDMGIGFVEENNTETYGTWAINGNVMYKINNSMFSYLSILNWGPRTKVYSNSVYSVKLPFTYELGFLYMISFSDKHNLNISSSLIKYNDQVAQLSLGANFIVNYFSINTGIRAFHDTYKVSFGFGFNYSDWSLNYAIVPLLDDLGIWQMISINLRP